MKRLLPLLLLLAILTPSLASCGGKTPAAATVPATVTVVSTAKE